MHHQNVVGQQVAQTCGILWFMLSLRRHQNRKRVNIKAVGRIVLDCREMVTSIDIDDMITLSVVEV